MSATLTPPKPPSLWQSLQMFLRFEYLTFALMLPLQGAISVTRQISWLQVGGLLLAVFLFHVYVSVLNDVMDLELDKTQPSRALYPLVRGVIQPWQALVIALVPLPLLLAFTYWLQGGVWAYVGLGLGIVFMGIYNIWGKKTRAPVVIDVVQGVGFAGMVLYGADLVGEPTRLTGVVFAAVVLWMVHTNFYGGFRDVETDHAMGLYTSPIQFGVRRTTNGLQVPAAARLYSLVQGVVMAALCGLVVWWNDFGYPTWVQGVLFGLTVLFGAFILFLIITFFGVAATNYADMLQVGVLVFAFTAASFLVISLPAFDPWLAVFVAVVFGLKVASMSLAPVWRYWQQHATS